jgi:hypothetical protein
MPSTELRSVRKSEGLGESTIKAIERLSRNKPGRPFWFEEDLQKKIPPYCEYTIKNAWMHREN